MLSHNVLNHFHLNLLNHPLTNIAVFSLFNSSLNFSLFLYDIPDMIYMGHVISRSFFLPGDLFFIKNEFSKILFKSKGDFIDNKTREKIKLTQKFQLENLFREEDLASIVHYFLKWQEATTRQKKIKAIMTLKKYLPHFDIFVKEKSEKKMLLLSFLSTNFFDFTPDDFKKISDVDKSIFFENFFLEGLFFSLFLSTKGFIDQFVNKKMTHLFMASLLEMEDICFDNIKDDKDMFFKFDFYREKFLSDFVLSQNKKMELLG